MKGNLPETVGRFHQTFEAPITAPLLRVQGLTKHFPIREGILRKTTGAIRAVDGVSFSLDAGETLGLVGESGCGKSTLARTVVRLEKPTGGQILFDGVDIAAHGYRELRPLRRRMQIVFQDPYDSLDPRKRVREILTEGWRIHSDMVPRRRWDEKLRELMSRVGLGGTSDLDRFPHEFSGGQRQRIGIARALSMNPEVIVCDEPVSALDMSVQAQILNLLMEIREDLNVALLFIAHDLSVVRHLCDRIAVMYLGRIVEYGDRDEVFGNPRHPYTQALLSASPSLPSDAVPGRERITLVGDLPSPSDPPTGCHFRTRCWKAVRECAESYPPMIENPPGHGYACYRA